MLIVLPLKSTKKIDIETPLRLWTESSHTQYSADDISSDLKRLNSLRSEVSACISSPDSHAFAFKRNCMSDLIEYHACLMECLNHGFPGEAREADVNGLLDAGVYFYWNDAFAKYGDDINAHKHLAPRAICHLNYERLCVLWNIAALMTYQAASEESWSTKESRSKVIHLYQVATKILIYIQYTIKDLDIKENDWSLDLCHDSLIMCQQICLAQGQICAYVALKEKLHVNSTSATYTLLAKIAAGVASHADKGLVASQSQSIKNTLGGKVLGGHLKLLSILFRARSEFLVSQVEKKSGKYGNEIARLERTVNMAEEGMKFMRNLSFQSAGSEGPSLIGTLPFSIESLLSNAKSRLTQVIDENARVYFERIPSSKNMVDIDANYTMEIDNCSAYDLPIEFTPICLERPMFE